MPLTSDLSDEDLLLSVDPEDFGRFYDRHVHGVLAYAASSIGDAELVAAVTGETFAAAVLARRRYRTGAASPDAWLLAIAERELVGALRGGGLPGRQQRRVGMARLPLSARDRALIGALGREPAGDHSELAASAFVAGLRAELVVAAEREDRRQLPRLPMLTGWRARRVIAALAAAASLVLAAAGLLSHAWGRDARGVSRSGSDPRPLFDGTVRAGVRYRTEAVDPPLELTFRDGRWTAQLTDPGIVVISREPADPIGTLTFGRSSGPVYAPGSHRAERPAPRDLMTWLRAQPDVVAGPVRDTRLAGHDARVMDYRFSFRRPAHEAMSCRGLGYACTALAPDGDAHRDGEHDRLWQVRTSRGPLIITVAGIDAGAFHEVLAAAMPTLNRLEIDG